MQHTVALLSLGLTLLLPTFVQAQGYIDCAAIPADDEEIIDNYGGFTENGYTCFFATAIYSNLSVTLPVINGDPYTTMRFFDVASYLAVFDNNCNQIPGTYIDGSDGDEIVSKIAVDLNGNTMVAGETGSSDFFTTDGSNIAPGAFSNFFLRKYQPDGTLLFSIIYPAGSELITDLVVDGTDIYVTGSTSACGFSTTDGTILAGANDGYITRFKPSGKPILLR